MRIKSHREKIRGWNCKKNFNSKSHLKNSNKKNEDQILKKYIYEGRWNWETNKW